MEKYSDFSLERIILFGYQIDQLKHFYVQYFNFTIVEEVFDQWVVLQAGHMQLALHKVGAGYEPEDGAKFKAESNTKLVFRLKEGIEQFRERLKNDGFTIGDIKSFEGYDSLFCDGEDIEGNVFQIEQSKV